VNPVALLSSIDGLRAAEVRLLEEAAKLGPVHLLLPSDAAVCALSGQAPRFPFAERLYLARALRYVERVCPFENATDLARLSTLLGTHPAFCLAGTGLESVALDPSVERRALPQAHLAGFPGPGPFAPSGRPRVVVTGCYDWLHSGHLAFFEEAASLGDLYVCLGNDINIASLKGPGHPLFPASERRYLVGSIRFVTQALVSTGMGQLDAEEEILNVIRPALYAVNEDGHKPEKAVFCERHGIRYVVLKRIPKEGLAARSSTSLRGF